MKPRRSVALLLVLAALILGVAQELGAQARPAGEMMIALHVTLAPAWFDPAETPAQITPFALLFALHDALVRPMPGERMGNSLAESWTESPDGLVYEFKLRPGLRFHNGDLSTTEDVQFSFTRCKGAGAKELHV
jgi:peptide/nickel transport system substrate-binding protein